MIKKLIFLAKMICKTVRCSISDIRKEENLEDLIKPIRKWLKGNPKRNALIILSEPRGTHHLVLATNTTGNDMIPDMGMIVGMEPQLQDVLLMIHDFAMDIEPLQEPVTDWEDTIDYTASSSGRPEESVSRE